MIRLVLVFLLMGAYEARCDLINTQSAAKDLCGIVISRDENIKAPPGERPLVVKYDPAKVGAVLAVVVRNGKFEEIGKFDYASHITEVETDVGQARFYLKREYLHRSFLKTENYIIPLRLYFDDRGERLEEPVNTNVEATSSFSLNVWPVSLSFYKALYGPAKKSGSGTPGEKLIYPQSKTQEELFRSWGLVPPEGTVYYPGRGKSAVVLRSTKDFLNKLESELKNRAYLMEEK